MKDLRTGRLKRGNGFSLKGGATNLKTSGAGRGSDNPAVGGCRSLW